MLLLLIFCFPTALKAHLGYSKESFCLDEMTSGSISLACPAHQLIQLGRIVYGYSWSNECSYIDKDCTMDVPREEITCSSTANCTVRVVEHPLILQDCWNLAATYIQAEFECITDYSLQNLCQSQDSDLSHGYLSSPSYPHGFHSNLNCLCLLSPSSGHSIVLELIDFHLPTCSDAGLVLRLGEEIQTKCSTQNPLTLLGNPHQNLTLRFYSSSNVTRGGVLMKYSVSPVTNNATVRLQCQMMSTIYRALHSLPSGPVTKSIAQQISKFDRSIEKKSPTVLPSSNSTMLIVSVASGFVFLVVMGNLLIWFLCALRSRVPKSSLSEQNLYSRPNPLQTERPFLTSPPVPPSSSTRLKTLHSLLYLDRKTAELDVRRSSSIDDLDSTLSDPLRTTCSSSSSNLTHGFIIRSKFNSQERQPRQIHSWDEI